MHNPDAEHAKPLAARSALLLFCLALALLSWGCARAIRSKMLYTACDQGDAGRVQSLLRSDPGLVNSKSDIGYTPLHYGADAGHTSVVRVLIQNGANVNAVTNRGSSPLHLAALAGHKPVAQVLLAHGATVNAQDHSGDTPLHDAIAAGHLDMVILLTANGADVNAATHSGATPLQLADGDKGIVRVLRQHGAKR